MKTRIANVVVLVVAGIVGGALSNAVFQGRSAQGKGVAKEVRAERFVMVDELGVTRAELGLLKDEQPGLALYDEAGSMRAMLGLEEDGRPVLEFYDEAGRRQGRPQW